MPVDQERFWIEQLQQGNPDGLRRIYEAYKDDLLTVAICLLIGRAAAEDCLHDVFVSLAANPASIQIHSTLKGFLITCIANRARDQLRRDKRLTRVPLEDIQQDLAAGAEPAMQSLIDREETARLYDALARLPYEQREVITLHLHGPLTFQEIAQQLRLSINTVQSRYRYGLEKLRTLLNTGAQA